MKAHDDFSPTGRAIGFARVLAQSQRFDIAGIVVVAAGRNAAREYGGSRPSQTASNTLAVVVPEYWGYSGRIRMRVAPSF